MILDHDGLAETARDAVGQEPRHHVGGGAGSGRDDELDRAARPGLRTVCALACAANISSKARQQRADTNSHGILPALFAVDAQCMYRARRSQAWRMTMSGELHLVGSIPLDTPRTCFATFGAPLGEISVRDAGRRGRAAAALDQPRALSGAGRASGARGGAAAGARRERGRAAEPAQRRRCLVVQGEGRRRTRALRRSGLAARLRARRHQLLLRVQAP